MPNVTWPLNQEAGVKLDTTALTPGSDTLTPFMSPLLGQLPRAEMLT